MPVNQVYTDLFEQIKKGQKSLFWQNNQGQQNTKDSLIGAIKSYLSENRITLEGYSPDELAEKIYNDLAEDSILTGPLNDIWVENIRIASWDKVSISFINGRSVRIDGFNSPKHSEDVLRSLFKKEGLDSKLALISGKTSKGHRITAFFPPYVSSDTGVCCMIQKRRQRGFSDKDFISNDFGSQKELEFLSAAINQGLSILIVGPPGSGKTSLMDFLTGSVPDTVVVEQSYREISAGQSILLNEDARPSECIDAIIGLNPDLIAFNLAPCVAQEAGLQGFSVLATVRGHDPPTALRQAATQWQSCCRDTTDSETALLMTGETFQLIVTLHVFADQKRRISDITECTVDGGQIRLRTIWEYQVHSINESGSGSVIRGSHKQVSGCSKNLLRRVRLNGAEKQKELFEMEDNHAESDSNWPSGGRPAAAGDQ